MTTPIMSLFSRDDRPASQLTDDELKKGCVKWDPAVDNSYHYKPHLAPGLIFSILFGLSFLIHVAQTAIKRKWWYLAFALGALGRLQALLLHEANADSQFSGELMGWAARTDSHNCPYKDIDFMLQIAVLIIGKVCVFDPLTHF